MPSGALGFYVIGTHTYADSGAVAGVIPPGGTGTAGTYTIRVHVVDQGGASVNVSNTATINDRLDHARAEVRRQLPEPGQRQRRVEVRRHHQRRSAELPGHLRAVLDRPALPDPDGGRRPTQIGQATAGADGSWSITTSHLADGAYVISATATDQFGQTIALVAPAGHFLVDPTTLQILPTTTQGPLVIDTVGPKVSNVAYAFPFTGQVNVSYTDELSGLVPSTLTDAANYSLTKNKQAFKSFLVNGAALTGDPLNATVNLLINDGSPLKGGVYNLTIHAAGVHVVSGVQDAAGNPLDGEFYGTFPSGNNTPGGDFVAQLDSVHRLVFPAQTVIGTAAPVAPPALPSFPFSRAATRTAAATRLATSLNQGALPKVNHGACPRSSSPCAGAAAGKSLLSRTRPRRPDRRG